jgi:RimJ/RimL family protein N-acetyltransferase|tara:strand:+ start:2873 stop:3310 length:438 start_codon:yes stop_codon:yes gene_type:complete
MVRLMEKKDVPFFNSVRNECGQYLHDKSTHTLDEAYDWFERVEDPYFIYKVNGRSIGYFRTSDWTENSCYIGMDIHKDYRGKKFAVPAYDEMMEHLVSSYGIQLFKLEVLGSNVRAQKLYEKLGFKQVGVELLENDESVIMELEV